MAVKINALINILLHMPTGQRIKLLLYSMVFFSQKYISIWRRKWQPSPVFLPEKSHEQRSLAGHSPWDGKETQQHACMNLELFQIKGFFFF